MKNKPHINVGTIGHVDYGKSKLAKDLEYAMLSSLKEQKNISIEDYLNFIKFNQFYENRFIPILKHI